MQHNPSIESSRRLYAFLLHLYPRAHRAEYAASMQQVFTDQCRSEFQAKGKIGLFFLWLRTLPDLGYTAFVEQIASPQASWGLMEPVPNAPLPWKGIFLILLPGMVYLVSQIAQLTGQPWYLLVYYRAAFFLILPPVAVWIFTRRFPLWGLIPVGLLFRLLQEIGYQLVALHPGVFSPHPVLNVILKAALAIQSNPGILAAVFGVAIAALLIYLLRRVKPERSFWVAGGLYLAAAGLQVVADLIWTLPYTQETFTIVERIRAWEVFRANVGAQMYELSACLLLVLLGTFFSRRHGSFTILILVGYILPNMVIGIPWNLEQNVSQIAIITTAVLAYRGLLSFVMPVWMSRMPTRAGKKRVVLVLAAAALLIHGAMQFYPPIFSPALWGFSIEWVLPVAMEEITAFLALILGLALYREAPDVDESASVPAAKAVELSPEKA